MKVFQRIFASAYIFYSKFKYEDPLFSGVIIVTAIQLLSFFFTVALLRLLTGFLFMPKTVNALFWTTIGLLWIFLVWRYFKSRDYTSFVEEFRRLPKTKRKSWAWVTGLIIPVLAILTAIFLVVEKRNR